MSEIRGDTHIVDRQSKSQEQANYGGQSVIAKLLENDQANNA